MAAFIFDQSNACPPQSQLLRPVARIPIDQKAERFYNPPYRSVRPKINAVKPTNMSVSRSKSPDSNPLIHALGDAIETLAITEYQFQREADMLRALRQAIPDLMLQLRADGLILNVNRWPSLDLLHTSAEILRTNVTELLPVESAQAMRRAMDCTLREQTPTICEWRLVIDHEEKQFEVRVSYLDTNQVLATVRDITAQYQALEQLRAVPRRLLNAQEAERHRLSNDLHDELGQDLTAILLSVHQAQGGTTGALRTTLETVEASLQALMRKVRRLAQDLHPATLEEFGLSIALRSLLQSATQQAALRIELSLPAENMRFSPEIERTVYRSVQEALTNIVRHAQAQRVTVDVRQQDQWLLIQIIDDGQGFDNVLARQHATYGLRSLRERVLLLNGRLEIDTAPGRGTHLTIQLPATIVSKE